eukprot:1161453-Pelagomonas_calceolata.AAC.2
MCVKRPPQGSDIWLRHMSFILVLVGVCCASTLPCVYCNSVKQWHGCFMRCMGVMRLQRFHPYRSPNVAAAMRVEELRMGLEAELGAANFLAAYRGNHRLTLTCSPPPVSVATDLFLPPTGVGESVRKRGHRPFLPPTGKGPEEQSKTEKERKDYAHQVRLRALRKGRGSLLISSIHRLTVEHAQEEHGFIASAGANAKHSQQIVSRLTSALSPPPVCLSVAVDLLLSVMLEVQSHFILQAGVSAVQSHFILQTGVSAVPPGPQLWGPYSVQ